MNHTDNQPAGATEELETLVGTRGSEFNTFPVSFGQQRLWFLNQMQPESAAYHLAATVRLHGPLDRAALRDGLNALVERHETLRTSFPAVRGQPFQVILPELALDLPEIDLRALPAAERADAARRHALDDARAPFDLARAPLLRATLLRLDEQEALLVVTLHHIIADGWSIGVFIRDLGELYSAARQGRAARLPELPIQYADFAAWQRDWLKGELLERELGYWRAQLDGVPATLELPTDHPRPIHTSDRGARWPLTLPAGLVARLGGLGRAEGATPFMMLLAAFQTLLYRYSGQEHFLVGTPVAGRGASETIDLIGFFVNTLALRADVAGDPPFRSLLRRVRDGALEAYAHQELPFERLVAALGPERDQNHSPLFQVMFVLQNAPAAELRLDGLASELRLLDTATAKVDLMLDLTETPAGLEGWIEYSRDLFAEATIARMAGHLQVLLEGIAADPDCPVSALPLLTEAERAQIVGDWRATAPTASDQSLAALFEQQAALRPDAVALVGPAGAGQPGDLQITYAELNRRANQLAWHLRALGAGPETLVGLYAARSPALILATLAVVKAGAAYLPLDPTYPAERLQYMLADAQVSVLLTAEEQRTIDRKGVLHTPPAAPGQPVVIDLIADWPTIAQAPETNPDSGATPDNLAYVIYTSGSTGRPKGVRITQRGIVRLVKDGGYADLSEAETLLQFAPIAFDAATFEIWGSLLNGARLVVPPARAALDELGRLLLTYGVTTLWLTAGLFHQIVESDLAALGGLRQLLAGGDALSAGHVRRMLRALPGCRLINGYGPTESTTFACCHTATPADPQHSVPIGRPIRGTEAYVLDQRMQPVPAGVPGELYLGGAGLARDYLGRPDLTAERFLPSPWSVVSGPLSIATDNGPLTTDNRLYRTGDRVRWLPDGTLEFLGRLDQQVKIRGFRVEPGEIAAALERHPAVRAAAVIAHKDVAGDKRLVAYVVTNQEQRTKNQEQTNEESHSQFSILNSQFSQDLRQFLADRLPDYMLPAAFVLLDRLPLTPNGKLDRRALPEPDWAGTTDAPAALPRTPLEELLAAVWTQVLGHERVGIHDNFFDQGGHSLLATRLLARVREAVGVAVPLRDFFAAPSVAGLAERVARLRGAEPEAELPIEPLPRGADPSTGSGQGLPLSFAQQRMWFLDRIAPGNTAYALPAAWRISGALDTAVLQRSLDMLIERHELLRTIFATVDGRPVQRILPELRLALPLADLRPLPEEAREPELRRRIQAEARRPFDLVTGPLMRAVLFQLDSDEYMLFVAMHHIIMDGWSIGVITEELGLLYRDLATGRTPALPALPIQFADYAAWQQRQLQGEWLEQHLAWWKRHLGKHLPDVSLPTDRPRPAVQSFSGASHDLRIAPELTGALVRLGRRADVTLFMTMLTAFNILLHKYSGQHDIVVGTPIANRGHSGHDRVVGPFVNTLVLRSDLAGDPSVHKLLRRARELTLDAYAHQELPFEQLVDALLPRRDMSRNPLFQVAIAFQNMAVPDLELDGLTVRPLELENGTAQFDLSLTLTERDGGLNGRFTYNTDLFDAATIECMAERLGYLLEQIAADPTQRLSQLSLLTPAERRTLAGWNDTHRPYRRDECVHQQFECQAALRPDAPVVAFRDQQVSYRELNVRANRLAHRLQALQVGPGALVGVCAERSIEMMVGMLAVLKAGAAYIPIDPRYPAERIGFVLRDARAALLLTQSHLAEALPSGDAPVAYIDDAEAEQWSAENPASAVTPDHLAYVIYTSGSTGRPKGAMLSHRNVSYFFNAADADANPDPPGVLLAVVSFAFDVSVLELLWTMTRGFLVVIQEDQFDRRGIAGGDEYSPAAQMRRYGVTHLFCIPSFARTLLLDPAARAALRPLRVIWLGGEVLTPALAQQLGELVDGEIFNVYGPTEVAVWSHTERVRPGAQLITLGRPVPNAEVYILDAQLQPAPVGIAGEICIGGHGVGRGYLRRPDLTAERFIPNPFGKEKGKRQKAKELEQADESFLPSSFCLLPSGERLYRSGDLGRLLPDGRLEFLGRIDHQIKLRGFRIEAHEIERTLEAHPAVGTAVVVMREDVPGDQRLIAYVVPGQEQRTKNKEQKSETPDSQFSILNSQFSAELRVFLTQKLPEYMVPSTFVLLDALPLMPSGKVDRRALPAPDGARDHSAPYAAPATEAERRLAAIWRDLLGTEQVGVHDNFFEAGGSSLLLAQMHSRLRDEFARELPLVDIFSHPTISALAQRLAPAEPAPEPVADKIGERARRHAEAAHQNGKLQRQKQLLSERRRRTDEAD